jgi:hypothetical protein
VAVTLEISIAVNVVLAIALTLKWMAYVALSERAHGQRSRAERFATLAASLRAELSKIKDTVEKPVASVPRATIPASKPMTAPVSEPSFERTEAEALQAQEKYYEPHIQG